MNDLESQQATAGELVSLAGEQGIDLSSVYFGWAFLKEGRFISLWRKGNMVHYSLQGPIKVLPERYRASASAFRGMWDEAGSLAGIEQAFGLLKDWLLEKKEVDELPPRSIRREGIG